MLVIKIEFVFTGNFYKEVEIADTIQKIKQSSNMFTNCRKVIFICLNWSNCQLQLMQHFSRKKFSRYQGSWPISRSSLFATHNEYEQFRDSCCLYTLSTFSNWSSSLKMKHFSESVANMFDVIDWTIKQIHTFSLCNLCDVQEIHPALALEIRKLHRLHRVLLFPLWIWGMWKTVYG